VADLEGLVSDGDGVALVEPAVGLEGVGMREAELGALFRQAVDPELVPGVRPLDRDPEALRQLGGAAGVVDVRVGQQDLLDLCTLLLGGCEDQVQIATRVDDGALVGGVAAQQDAVLLERGDGDDGRVELQRWRRAGRRGGAKVP
jgi:hypothetical protein